MLHLRAAIKVDEAVAVKVILDEKDGAGLVAVEFTAGFGIALDIRNRGVTKDGDVIVSGGLGLAVEPEAGSDFEVIKHSRGRVSDKGCPRSFQGR